MKKMVFLLAVLLVLMATMTACSEEENVQVELSNQEEQGEMLEPCVEIEEGENFSMRAEVADFFFGVWQNGLGMVLAFPDEEWPVERWEVSQDPNGAYIISAIASDGSHNTYWLFPPGVEMIRYITDMSVVASDPSGPRLFQGSFELRTCCPEEEVVLEVFYPMWIELPPQPTQTEDIMTQLSGFWRMDWPNPANASIILLFPDGRWEMPGPLPTDHSMGGSFTAVGESEGLYRLSFTIEHSTSPYDEIGGVLEGYYYDQESDQIFMEASGGEGSFTIVFIRGFNPPV